MKTVMALILALSLVGCGSWVAVYPTQRTLKYFRDPRTGNCFAAWWGGGVYGGPGLATVSCNNYKLDGYLIDLPKE